MKLFRAEEVDQIPWPDSVDGRYARMFFDPLLRHGSSHFFSNVDAEIFLLVFGEKVLPVTPGRMDPGSCYVSSPYDHYIRYARVELETIGNRWVEIPCSFVLWLLGLFLRWARINNVIYVNNWFLSTNLYPALNREELEEVTAFLQQQFPGRVVMFRSLNEGTDARLLEVFDSLGYSRVLSRQLYVSDLSDSSYRKKRDYKNDRKLLDSTVYEVVDGKNLSEEEIGRVIDLYNALYLEKYTELNPHFTVQWIRTAIEQDLLHVKLLVRHGRIDGVLGFFERGGVMTTPLLGYDTSVPIDLGLYRLLSILLLVEAQERGLILNQSSGAAGFKRGRGAVGYLEYSMVHVGAAGFRERCAWWTLGSLMRAIAEPLLRRYEL
mgnify:CR=1 FL=1